MINTTIFKSAFIFLAISGMVMSHPVEKEVEKPEVAAEVVESSKPETVVQVQNESSKPETVVQSSKPPSEDKPTVYGDHYDQRQNGTKNFRLNIDGVVLVVAPAEAMFLAGAGDLSPSIFDDLKHQGFGPGSKPGAGRPETRKPQALEDAEKPIKQKSAHSHGLRLSSILGPLLRHISSPPL